MVLLFADRILADSLIVIQCWCSHWISNECVALGCSLVVCILMLFRVRRTRFKNKGVCLLLIQETITSYINDLKLPQLLSCVFNVIEIENRSIDALGNVYFHEITGIFSWLTLFSLVLTFLHECERTVREERNLPNWNLQQGTWNLQQGQMHMNGKSRTVIEGFAFNAARRDTAIDASHCIRNSFAVFTKYVN